MCYNCAFLRQQTSLKCSNPAGRRPLPAPQFGLAPRGDSGGGGGGAAGPALPPPPHP